jgi:hypothetical protein
MYGILLLLLLLYYFIIIITINIFLLGEGGGHTPFTDLLDTII